MSDQSSIKSLADQVEPNQADSGPKDLIHRLHSTGPKRLLSLNGGGIRGFISLAYLSEIESLLRKRYQRPNLVLADYFDLIGGTSTGAAIATMLSLGWSVAQVRKLYLDLGQKAFQPKKSFFGKLGRMLGVKFDERPLEQILRDHLGERRLDSQELRTGLLIVIKRVDTGSVWAMVNIPSNKFYAMNRHFLLSDLLRASTAAPTFFRPQFFSDVGNSQSAAFVDGGISMYNNPSLKLLMVASLEGFGLKWPHGADRMLMCSVGTGSFTNTPSKEAIKSFTSLNWAGLLIDQFIHDAKELNETLMQWISNSPTAISIDSQIGTMENDLLGRVPLLSYQGYNVALEQKALSELGLNFSPERISALRNLSDARNMQDLDQIGRLSAAKMVKDAHFPPCFDPCFE